ncbi:hypothetical protein [Mariniblastus fucicola]|uniref:hypothetical protein n=1 Tax=Mariniblastus fucicola TaxID=980251 RepID=UPI0011DFD782|nr:hypothetical protein [Mariniblastus fucicola]
MNNENGPSGLLGKLEAIAIHAVAAIMDNVTTAAPLRATHRQLICPAFVEVAHCIEILHLCVDARKFK